MSKRQIQQQPKPIEQWTVKDWEAAYNQLHSEMDKLKNKMRLAFNYMSQAQQRLSEAVV